MKDLRTIRLGRKPALPQKLEEELVSYCILMDKKFYGLRCGDIKFMAYQLALKNDLPHSFNTEKQTAGKKWLRSFIRRHPRLSLRRPEGLSSVKSIFNQQNVDCVFDIYKKELEKINHNPHRLFNVDETGHTVVQHK